MSYPFPILNLNFAESKQLGHPAVSFSRASQGSYWHSKTNTNADGLLAYAGNNVPRFDHDPLTGICKGLLVEPAVTFLDTYSEQFDNAAWSKVRATITPNAVVAPDGTMTADKLVEDASASNTHYVSRTVTVADLATYTISVFLKKGDREWAALQGYTGAAYPTAWFNLSTGAIGTLVAGATATMKDFGNGWYHCSINFTMSSGTSAYYTIMLGSANASHTYNGDGTSGIYIWGAKIYAGTGPTSYLPTTSAGVTCAADFCVADLTKLKDSAGNALWTGQEGTIVIDATCSKFAPISTVWQHLFQLDDGTGSNHIIVVRDQYKSISIASVVSGVFKTTTPTGVVAENGSRLRLAMSIDSEKSSVSISGSTVFNTTAHTIPTTSNSLRFYSLGSPSSTQFDGTYSLVQLYNKRIPDAHLKLLSAL